MSKVKIQGNASGTGVVTLTAPNTNTDRTITLPDGTGDIGIVTRATTAPTSPTAGDMWFDTTAGTTSMNVWSGTQWDTLSNLPFSATGGTETTSGGYKYHTFTSSGSFTTSGDAGTVDYLIVAGGGGGGTDSFQNRASGGGGAGGYISKSAITLTRGDTISIIIGAGGVGGNHTLQGDNVYGWQGANTTLSGAVSETAIGGGGGQGHNSGGTDASTKDNGGSGGGTSNATSGVGTGVTGQGSQGYISTDSPSGTGGGNGETWSNGITYAGGGAASGSEDNWYGGGGGGKGSTQAAASTGGTGGGGNSSHANTAFAGGNGAANTGGGGGGSRETTGASGGSGIVIIRYAV